MAAALVIITLLGYCFLFARVVYLDTVINEMHDVPWFKDSIALNKAIEEHSNMLHQILKDPAYRQLELNFTALSNEVQRVIQTMDQHKKHIANVTGMGPVVTNNNKGCKCEKRAQRVTRDNKDSV